MHAPTPSHPFPRALGLVAATMLLAGTATPALSKSDKQSCTIMLLSDGRIGQSIDLVSLSSNAIGGQGALLDVTTSNGSYSLTVTAPVAFTVFPAGNAPNVLFDAMLSGYGASQFSAEPDGVPVKLKPGTTTVTVDLTATLLSGHFRTGDYQAQTTVLCE